MMLVGKYVFLALIYGFLYWAFRGLFTQTALEARSQRPVGAPQPAAVPAPILPPPPPAPVAAVAPVVAGVEPVAPPASSWAAEQPVAVLKPALLVDDPGQSGLAAGQVIELTAAVTMGRAEDNGLVINDKFCSSHHAMIFLQAGQRVLRDRASTNGTYHNGQKVEGDVILVDGDKVGVGSVVFTYRAG
jgi:hypothetical protein